MDCLTESRIESVENREPESERKLNAMALVLLIYKRRKRKMKSFVGVVVGGAIGLLALYAVG